MRSDTKKELKTAKTDEDRDISEKREEEMRSRLASIVEYSDDAIIGKTLDGIIVSWNRGAEKIYGYSAGEVTGKHISILVPPHIVDEVPKIMDRIKKGEMVKHYESARVRKDGRQIDVSITISPIKDAGGRIVGFSTIARDITERKQMEEKLRTASMYARSLIEASLDPLVTIGPDGKITDVNEATELVTGVSRELLIGSDFSEYFTEPEKAREGYQQVFSKGFVRDYPLAIRHTSGKVTEVLYNATVYKNEAGEVQGVFAAARDITERKRAEEQLRATSLYARSLIEASLDPLVTISPDGKITDVNKATELVTGVPREQLIGSDFSEYFTEPEKAREGYQEVFTKGFVRDYPLAIRHTSGKVTEVLYNASIYKNEAGGVEGVFAVARDITELKRAEEQLRATSLYARSLIEASIDPLATISPDGKITDVNKATELVTGVPREQLIGSDFSEYFTEPEKAREGYREVFTKGFVKDYPLAIRHTSGEVTYVLYNATVYKNEAGEVQGVFAAARDITELKRAEEQLRRAHQELEVRVQERTAELTKAMELLKEQQKAFMEVSVPVVKVWNRILLVPLIGVFDSERAQLVMETLLTEIEHTQAKVAILDVSGIPIVDSLVAKHLIRTVSAAKLMGADCIITGIRSKISQTIVQLGVDLSGITTKTALAEGLKVAFDLTDQKIVSK